jgi:hypothetical protein
MVRLMPDAAWLFPLTNENSTDHKNRYSVRSSARSVYIDHHVGLTPRHTSAR